MNLPNLLTIIRIFLVPLLIVALLYFHKDITATLIFSIAALTDWLDGHIARKRNQVTDFGILLDPVADKLLISASLISLVGLQRVQTWIAVILIGRELAVTALRGMVAKEGYIMAAEKLGKLKLTAQIAAIIIIMSNLSWLIKIGIPTGSTVINIYPGIIALYISIGLFTIGVPLYARI